jgi:hypothetical protein
VPVFSRHLRNQAADKPNHLQYAAIEEVVSAPVRVSGFSGVAADP